MHGLLKFIYAKKLTVIFFAFLGDGEKKNYGNIFLGRGKLSTTCLRTKKTEKSKIVPSQVSFPSKKHHEVEAGLHAENIKAQMKTQYHMGGAPSCCTVCMWSGQPQPGESSIAEPSVQMKEGMV